jgi:MFS family permease
MKGMSYKWVVATVVIFGTFMSILDTTIVNIAIPRLQTAFGAGLTDVDWVATGYTLAEGAGTPLTPFFSAFLGTKRFYLIILALFTIGSALCGLAWSLTALIAFRIIRSPRKKADVQQSQQPEGAPVGASVADGEVAEEAEEEHMAFIH